MEKLCKLDYLTKRLTIKDKKELYFRMDLEGIYDFGRYESLFLQDTKTEDPYKMTALFDKSENARKIFVQKYVDLFQKFNELCIKNQTYPLFLNPENVEECAAKRLELIEMCPEEELNKIFNVNSFKE